MHYFEEEFSSYYFENINSSSQFQRFEKRKLQNVKVTCTKFGTCERNDGNLIKLGFQPKSKNPCFKNFKYSRREYCISKSVFKFGSNWIFKRK